MKFQVTVRYGHTAQRYHTFQVEAPEAGTALRIVADQVPSEILHEVDLVELRRAVDPETGRSAF
jgi:hypothetical protein